MNGRIYDPLLGRFLSPDPFVQQPWNLQNYNRYSYALNNPLRYTDPSGYLTKSEHEEEIKKLKEQIEANRNKYKQPRGANRELKREIAGHRKAIKRIDWTAKSHNMIVDALATVTGTDKADVAHLKLNADELDDESADDAVFFGTGDKLKDVRNEAIGAAVGGIAGRMLNRAKVASRTINTVDTVNDTTKAFRRIPRGFETPQQFDRFVDLFKKSPGVDDAVVGVRGSASTGVSHTGRAFDLSSDIDFFLVSDKALAQGLEAGAKATNGALRVSATQKYFPSLAEAEKLLSNELGRKVTIRIFGKDGFDAVKTGTEIMGN